MFNNILLNMHTSLYDISERAAGDGTLMNPASMEIKPARTSSPRLSETRSGKMKSLSLDLDGPPADRPVSLRTITPTESIIGSRRLGRGTSYINHVDTKVFIVWLESYEDWQHFPSGEQFLHFLV